MLFSCLAGVISGPEPIRFCLTERQQRGENILFTMWPTDIVSVEVTCALNGIMV